MTTASQFPWQDISRPLADRVEALLALMTPEEKAAQLGSRWLGNDMEPDALAALPDGARTHQVAPMQDVFSAGAGIPLAEAARHGLGHLTRVFGSVPVTPAEGAAEVVRQQHAVLAAARLPVPAIVHEECLTGFTTFGATTYPAAIAWAATFDPDLVRRMAAAIGRDMSSLGVHQGLSPVLDVVRDYRWGRVEETLGEDPYLVATLGSAYVRGLQGSGVIATLKHFAGYSASRAGRNHAPVSMGRRELLDVVLPPFEAAVTAAGAGSVMNSYSDRDGVPAGADPWLLTEVLREQWGFRGTVVSDYWAVPFLASMHRVAGDFAEAGAQALAAGIDVELPDTVGFSELAVRAPEELLDRAARRVLTQKAELGLLDPDWTPEGSVAHAAADLDPPENRALARELAERSVVLLDPGTALPLVREDGPRRIAVVGPCADDPRTFMGCYAFANHVLPRYPDQGLGIDVPTALAALRTELPDTGIVHEPGCSVLGDDRSGIAAAVAAARDSDLCVALVGDLAGLFGLGSSGEGCDAPDLRLPGVQAELLDALLGTGVPVVVVVVSGRPYALGDVAGRAAGLVQVFMPGEEGGAAIAGVLSGRVNPGGRLPVQIPRGPGGQPGTYLQPPLGAGAEGISSVDTSPLFPFGHGRSYTEFELDELEIDRCEVPVAGEFTVAARLRNTGGRDGDAVVQLYLRDVVAQVVRPVRWLTGFARVAVPAGGAVRVAFRVHADRTAFTGTLNGTDLTRIVEPGEFEVLLGHSAGDLPLRGTVTLTGAVREVGPDRVLTTPATVTILEMA